MFFESYYMFGGCHKILKLHFLLVSLHPKFNKLLENKINYQFL